MEPQEQLGLKAKLVTRAPRVYQDLLDLEAIQGIMVLQVHLDNVET